MHTNPSLDMYNDKESSFHDPAELDYPQPLSFKEKEKYDSRTDCLKFILFAFNLTVCLFGATVLGIGIWMAVDRSFLTYVIGNDLYAVAIYMILIGGGLVFFLSFVGCCGAVTMNRCLLWTFMIVLCFLFFLLFLGGIIAGAFQAQIGSSVRDSMEKTLKESYGVNLEKFFNRQVTRAWDKAQERLFCCGVEDNSWSLYRGSKWYEYYGARDVDEGIRQGNEDAKPYVPRSCCVRDRFYRYANLEVCQMWRLGPPGSVDNTGGSAAINRALYYNGCFDAGKQYLQQNSAVLVGLGICLALLLIVGIVATFFLLRTTKKHPLH